MSYSQQWTIFNSSNSGLPSDNIFDIEFTSDSAIWFATDSGLACYDWNEWIVYDTSNSGLITNYITEVSFSDDGTMWVGCTSHEFFNDSTGGLVRFRDSIWTQYTTENSGLFYPHITEIESIGYDSLFIWSYPPEIPEQFGLMQFFDSTDWINIDDTTMFYWVSTVEDFEVVNGLGYAAMGIDGLAILEDNVWYINNINNSNLPGRIVTDIAVDESDDLWMIIIAISESQLFRYDGEDYYNYPYFPQLISVVTSLELDSDGDFWIGTQMDGLIKIEGNEFTFFDTSNSPLVTNNVNIRVIDSKDRLWLWNWQQPGIVVFDPDAITTVDDQFSEEMIPGEFKLYQNYPNPFNPSTKISWQSPVSSHQSIKIYDILGNQVATLLDAYKDAGSYEIEFNGEHLGSGIYFVRLTSGSQTEIIKINLLK